MDQDNKLAVDLVMDPTDEGVAATYKRIEGKTGVATIHRVLANAAKVFPKYIDLIYALRHDTVIDPAERELGIICVLERHGGEYELPPHRQFALALGVSEEQVREVRNPESPVYTPRQRAILRFANHFAISPAERGTMPIEEVGKYLNSRELVELGLNMAIYLGVSHFTTLIKIPEHTFDPTKMAETMGRRSTTS